MLRERQEVARQLIGGCSYSAGGKFYESLNAFVRVAKRTFRFRNNAEAQRRPWNGDEGAMERASGGRRPRTAAPCVRPAWA